jgi:hypothetical protein
MRPSFYPITYEFQLIIQILIDIILSLLWLYFRIIKNERYIFLIRLSLITIFISQGAGYFVALLTYLLLGNGKEIGGYLTIGSLTSNLASIGILLMMLCLVVAAEIHNAVVRRRGR